MLFIMGKKGRRNNNNSHKKAKNKKDPKDCVEELSEQVEGAKKCPHLSKAAKLGVLQNQVPHAKLGQCSFCDDDQLMSEDNGVCICLRCGKQGCDRYSKGQHGLAHYRDCPSHSITLHLQSMLVWCYACDMEVPITPNTDLHECVKLIIKALNLNAPNDQKLTIPKTTALDSTEKSDACGTNVLPTNANRKVKGLVNLGNTCFFNSVMQNLNQTELLHVAMAFVNQAKYSQRIVDNNNTLKLTVQVTNPAGSLILSLNKLLSEFRSSSPGPLSPKFLFSEICKKAPRFKGFRQQDSQELLRYLLDSVKTEQLTRVKIGVLKQFEVDEGVDIKNLPAEKKDTIKDYVNLVTAPSVDSVFAGKLDSIIVCHKCHKKSRVRESFLDLSLSLVKPQEPKVKPKPNKGSAFGKKKDNSEQISQTTETTVDKSSKQQTLSKHQQKAAKEAKRKKGKRKGRQRTSSRSISEDDALEVKQSVDNLSDDEEDTEMTEQEEAPETELEDIKSQQETITENSEPEVEEKPKAEVTLVELTRENTGECQDPVSSQENTQHSIQEQLTTKPDTNTQIDQTIGVKADVENDVISNRTPKETSDVENDAISHRTEKESIDTQNGVISNPMTNETSDVRNDVISNPIPKETSDVSIEDSNVNSSNCKNIDEETCNEETARLVHHIEPMELGDGDSSKKPDEVQDLRKIDAIESSNKTKENRTDVSFGVKVSYCSVCNRTEGWRTNGHDCTSVSMKKDEQGQPNSCKCNHSNEEQNCEMKNAWRSINNESQNNDNILNGRDTAIINGLDTDMKNMNVKDEETSEEIIKEEENSNTHQMGESESGIKEDEREVDGNMTSLANEMENLSIKDEGFLKSIVEEEKNSEKNTPELKNLVDNSIENNSKNCKKSIISTDNAIYGTRNDVMCDDENSTSSPRVFTIGPTYASTPEECSVQSCLSQFCSPEVLKGRNKFACEECSKQSHEDSDEDAEQASSSDDDESSKGAVAPKPKPERTIVYTEATKQLLLSSTPPVLTLHLKRFQQVGFGLKKLPKHVDFPLVLDLAPFCSRGEEISADSRNQVLYSLIGVVEHSGGLNSGHYTACVKLKYKPTYNHPSNITDFTTFIEELWKKKKDSSYVHERPGEGQWYYVSDSRVSMVTEEKVMRSQAYMLFYERLPLKETAVL